MTKKLSPEAKSQRKATRVACTFCSQKHLQCDDTRPCKNCTKRGFADTCKDAVRKKKKTAPIDPNSGVRKKALPPSKPPRPRGRPRKIKPVEKSPPPEITELPNVPNDTKAVKSPKPLKSTGSFPSLSTTGLSSLNLPNLTSLPSFLNTPKTGSFAQFPQSPLILNPAVHQMQSQQQMAPIPSFSDIKLNSSFWDVKAPNGGPNGSPHPNAKTPALARSPANLSSGFPKAMAEPLPKQPPLPQPKSSTTLHKIMNPPITTSPEKKSNSPSEDEGEGPLEFRANTSYATKSPPKSGSPPKTVTAEELKASESLIQLNELLSNASPTSIGTPYKKSNPGSTNGGNFNVGYAQQMNFEMDGLNYPSTSIMSNIDDEDSRPYIEINLEDGTMVSSYPNNGTPNSFVFNPSHSQMPNTAGELPSDIEQNDEYTSPLIMRHVIKHPDDIYLTSIVKSYQYPAAYHALIDYLKRRFNKLQLLEIAKCMAKYRPSFISATKSLYENDLIFTERSFQRTLLEYEHLISMSPSPTIIWRRTGEIVAMTNAFCVMTGYSKMSLLSKRTYIVELMDDESTIKYFRSFSDLAFGDLNATYLTDCNLRKANDDDYLKCCCVWTIKRDAFDIPMLIVGQFLPVLE